MQENIISVILSQIMDINVLSNSDIVKPYCIKLFINLSIEITIMASLRLPLFQNH